MRFHTELVLVFEIWPFKVRFFVFVLNVNFPKYSRTQCVIIETYLIDNFKRIFQIFPNFSGQSLIEENCHNSRTMLDKRNKATSNKFDNDVMASNCSIVLIFPIYSHFGAIWNQDYGHIVFFGHIFINSKFFLLLKLKTELK